MNYHNENSLFFLSSSIPIDKFGKDSTSQGKSAFLELTELSRLAEKNLLNNKLENGALIQTNSKSTSTTMKKKRYTKDNRACSDGFVQDGKTYNDCTTARSPDGEMTGNEWCYVEDSKPNVQNWDYCIPTMNEDIVRAKNQAMLNDITQKCNEVNKEIKQYIIPAKDALDSLKEVEAGQATLDTKIQEQKKKIDEINIKLASLTKVREKWEKMNKEISNIQFEIDKKKGLDSKRTVNYNCKGMLLYEDEPDGDGLIGKYYNNEYFLGSFKEEKDETIDLNCIGEGLRGMNSNNFSVVWDGYLKIPSNGNFIFVIEADDGAILEVNGSEVVKHRLQVPIEIDKTTKNPYKTYSEPVKLFGGTKVKISLKYYHSVHNDVNLEGLCYIKLYWKNEEFDEEIIETKYLYSSNSFPPLKVYDFNTEIAHLQRLYENDNAFKNSDKFIIQDIPPEFLGLTRLTFVTRIQDDVIRFMVNTPTVVYVAFLAHYSFFLPENFENTGLVMSMLLIDKSLNKTVKTLVAKKSSKLLIYKKKFAKGEVKIPLNKDNNINKQGIPLVMFFGFDSKITTPLNCGGELLEVSQSTSKHFKSCTASTEKEGWLCSAGFSGRNRDEEGSMWASNNEGVGAWIEVKFNGMFEIARFTFKDRKNPAERNKKLILKFSYGETIEINLKNTDEEVKYPIDHIKATGVRILIKEVYGTMNNGGAFNFIGVKCKSRIAGEDDEEEGEAANKTKSHTLEPLFVKSNNKIVNLSCRESFSNSYKFDNLIIRPFVKVPVKCPESCVNNDAPIYGYLSYSKDSAICKSAYHSNKITSKGGIVVVVFQEPKFNLPVKTSNGITSLGKAVTEFTYTFETYEEDDIIVLKAGSKIDVAKRGKPGWQPGIITHVIENTNGRFIKYYIEGGKYIINKLESNSNDQSLYPNLNIVHPCGSHLKDRDCKGSLKKMNNLKPRKFRFVSKEYQNPGNFVPDSGKAYDGTKPYGKEQNFNLGWSREMGFRIISKIGASKPELESFVKFPPSPNSRFCNRPAPDTVCETVDWKVYSGEGTFIVKIYSGDPTDETILNLSINGKVIIRNQIIPKNQLFIKEEKIESKNGFMVFSAECFENCLEAESKLNAVEIFPINDDIEEESIAPYIELPCGISFTGGRCDTGPDVLHCVFNDPNHPSVKYCNGEFSLVVIPKEFKCKDQVSKYKCVRTLCPGKCDGVKCKA